MCIYEIDGAMNKLAIQREYFLRTVACTGIVEEPEHSSEGALETPLLMCSLWTESFFYASAIILKLVAAKCLTDKQKCNRVSGNFSHKESPSA